MVHHHAHGRTKATIRRPQQQQNQEGKADSTSAPSDSGPSDATTGPSASTSGPSDAITGPSASTSVPSDATSSRADSIADTEEIRGYRITQAHNPNLPFQIKSFTQEEEDQVDFAALRGPNLCGVMFSTVNLTKCALGTGILRGHVAYMVAGYLSSTLMNIGFGLYMCFCFYLVGTSAQTIYRRCHLGAMSYPDLVEAAVGLFPNPKLSRFSSVVRHFIAFLMCLNLFGSCICYQLFLGKTIKQLVEDTHYFEVSGTAGYATLRLYVSVLILPFILLCLIPTLKYLAPFAIAGLMVVVFYVLMAVYYGFANNPKFEGMVTFTTSEYQVHYIGMAVLSMSCAGLLLPVEGNMQEPHKFKQVLIYSHILIIGFVFLSSFFGYAAYLDKCMEPLTMDFPASTLSSMLKVSLGLMIYVTHALNFFLPFNTVFYYVKKFLQPAEFYRYEIICRALVVTSLWLFAMIIPSVDSLLYFTSSMCIVQTALIMPNVITLLVCWERPGLGKYAWRLWRSLLFIALGLVVLIGEISVYVYDVLVQRHDHDHPKSNSFVFFYRPLTLGDAAIQ